MNLCWEFNFYPLKKGEKLLWFSLKLYNQVLLTFDYDNLPLSGEECRILWVDEDNKKLLPIGLKLTERGIISWLKSRVVHKKRANAEILLTKLGLSFNDILGIIWASQGLSLNDSYWVVEDGFDGKFENYNLYEKKFSRTLALIAYTGHGSSVARGFTSSPEFTTNGMLNKCWRRVDGKIYLYKGGTMGAANDWERALFGILGCTDCSNNGH